MSIYKYTLTKYAKSISTWVIVGISMFLVIVLGGFVPFKFANPKTATTYAVISVSIVAAITSFLSIFTSVFAGFKSATMFKDEVEDGTFLVMLSKPVNRGKIIFFKWLALQTAIAVYTLIVALSFLFAVMIFDTGNKLNESGELTSFGIKTLRSQIVLISLALWAILFIVSLIFSSIALLLSTKLSVGTTIGISIAIGVIIPITTLVGTFTSKPAYKSLSNTAPKTIDVILGSHLAQANDALAQMAKANGNNQIFSQIAKSITTLSLTDNPKTLYGLGLSSNEKDTFKFAQAFDFNYQIQKLSEFASEQAIPEVAREGLDFSRNGQSLKTVTNIESKDNPFNAEIDAQIHQYNELIKSSWEQTQPYRSLITQIIFAALAQAEIKDSITIPSMWINAGFVTETSLTEANKATVLAELSKANGMTEWINKPFADQTKMTDSNEMIRYMQANVGMNELLKSIDQRNELISLNKNSSSGDFDKIFFTLVGTGQQLFLPVTFWTPQNSVHKFIEEYDVTQKTFLQNWIDSQANKNDDARTDNLGYLKYIIRMKDSDAYNWIISSIQDGHNIAKIKTVEYTNKWTILWIYLALALVLVPVTYLVIRKQDFR